jgi:hypothetical protein
MPDGKSVNPLEGVPAFAAFTAADDQNYLFHFNLSACNGM